MLIVLFQIQYNSQNKFFYNIKLIKYNNCRYIEWFII